MTYPVVIQPGPVTADEYNAGFLIGRLVFFASRDTAQGISSGGTSGSAADALSWDNVIIDELDGYDSGSPTRYTPPIAGWYSLTGGAGFAASTGGTYRGVSWLVNGSLPVAGTNKPVAAATASTTVTVTARDLPVELNGSTDYVQLAPFHNSGSSLNTTTGSVRPYIAIYYAAPA